ncbi:mucin-2-like isoform X2 [Biomphalaria glabrata]|uniref:Mucin-2-like isoform X2 n=1 Tax=Biomphalaria glabrata TaxID=6526 RepID=A0A9W2Z337_BIOGL|nr:mucin-2-like isoform X2 [Biomphalaria glabrata]XP_055869467.1 mucin-2-like isoform X2 [Biomphalaria glabrata]
MTFPKRMILSLTLVLLLGITNTTSLTGTTETTIMLSDSATIMPSGSATIMPSGSGTIMSSSSETAQTVSTMSTSASATFSISPSSTDSTLRTDLADASSLTPLLTTSNTQPVDPVITSTAPVYTTSGTISTSASETATPPMTSQGVASTSSMIDSPQVNPTTTVSTQTPATTSVSHVVDPSSIQPSSTASELPSSSVYVETTTPAPITTTTPTTPSTTVKPALPHNTDSAYYILTLNVTYNRNLPSDIYYTNDSWNQVELNTGLNKLLSNPLWALSLEKDVGSVYPLRIRVSYSSLTNNNLSQSFEETLNNINDTVEFDIGSSVASMLSKFDGLISSPCNAINICYLGFYCKPDGCQHLCQDETCNGHGQCVADVGMDKTASTKCICDDSYDTEYYGDKCESSRTGKLQIIAIISGVLGAAILVLFIALLISCCAGKRRGSSKEYDFARKYDNGAYDNSDR